MFAPAGLIFSNHFLETNCTIQYQQIMKFLFDYLQKLFQLLQKGKARQIRTQNPSGTQNLSHNCRIGWRRPLRSLSPTVNPGLPTPPLSHVSKNHVYMSFKYLQGWRLHHFPGQPVPMFDNPFREEIFPTKSTKTGTTPGHFFWPSFLLLVRRD